MTDQRTRIHRHKFTPPDCLLKAKRLDTRVSGPIIQTLLQMHLSPTTDQAHQSNDARSTVVSAVFVWLDELSFKPVTRRCSSFKYARRVIIGMEVLMQMWAKIPSG